MQETSFSMQMACINNESLFLSFSRQTNRVTILERTFTYTIAHTRLVTVFVWFLF